MKWFGPAALLAVVPLALMTAVVSAQDEKKPKPPKQAKSRLPLHWSKLDLTDEQKEKYLTQAKDDLAKEDALLSEIKELKAKTSKLNEQVKSLKSGDKYLSILSPVQVAKLNEIKAESAKKSAEKAAEKAKKLATKVDSAAKDKGALAKTEPKKPDENKPAPKEPEKKD
jgi:hypothetical protein